MESTVLCADIGTTSLKAGLIDAKGEVAAVSQQNFHKPDDAHAALAWLPALCTAVQEMTSAEKKDISAICISGNGPTIVSEDGTTLLWNADIPSVDIYGTPAEKSLFIPRLAAFRKMFPSQWNSSGYIYSGPEFLIHQLCGSSLTILPEARYTESYWSETQLLSVSIPSGKLPPFVPIAYNAGNTTPEITGQLDLPHDVPIFCGGPDFVAAMIGTNSLTPGKMYDCAGSSEGVNLCTAAPVIQQGIRPLPSVIPELWNAAVLQTESGRLFVNFKKIVEAIEECSVSYGELISMSISNPDSDGFEILELVANNMKRSVKTLLDAAKKNNISVTFPVIVTGGQAKNEQWMQMKCNYTGVPLAVCNCPDAELIGDAVSAQTGLGTYSSIRKAADAIVKITKIYTPEHAE
ncbi:MAG: FGGY-family carbohydrate kinase [Treponema sp.]|nr:FGGY-family carbohydrate kinase [Treponema sp.]